MIYVQAAYILTLTVRTFTAQGIYSLSPQFVHAPCISSRPCFPVLLRMSLCPLLYLFTMLLRMSLYPPLYLFAISLLFISHWSVSA